MTSNGSDALTNETTLPDEFTLLSYEELGSALGVSTQTARSVVAAGHIPLVLISPRIHKVRLSDVKAYIMRGGARANV